MGFETVLVERRGAVAVVTLNRPQVLNALNRTMFEELDEVFAGFDAGVRAVVLTGAGEKAFAAGADIAELAETDEVSGEALSLRGQGVFRRIERCGKVVIAAINGFALGGGCELAMACTFRLAAAGARLGQPEVKLGLLPGYGGTQRLPRLVGQSEGLRLLLTGEMIGASEAQRIGLVDRVYPAGELLVEAMKLAETIAVQAPLAVGACLEAVYEGEGLGLEEALAVEATIFGRLSGTVDKREGVRAFLKKRAATWTGK